MSNNQNSVNLHFFLEDRTVSNKDKIDVLKKIGELLKRVQYQKQDFYL